MALNTIFGDRIGSKGLSWPLLACMVVLVLAPFWQARWGVSPDTSWLITVCEKLLAGERLYVDVIESNPPFSVWLYMPAVALAHWLGLAPETVVQSYAYSICILGLGFATYIATRARFPENAVLLQALPVFLVLLIVFPGQAFDEREQLGMALFAPMLVLMAWRSSPPAGVQPSWTVAALAGLCGSIIVLVKPHYAVAILLPALYVAWRTRNLRRLLYVEYWIIALLGTIYLASVVWLYPEYFRDVLPALADTSMRSRRFLHIFVAFAGPYCLAGLLLLLMCLRPPRSAIAGVAFLASAGATLPLILQGKGWAYHAYPAVALMLTALLCQVSTLRHSLNRASPIIAYELAVGLALLLNIGPFFIVTQKPDPEIVSAIRAYNPAPVMAQIGTGIEVGHPLVRAVGGRWASGYCSDWIGGFANLFVKKERAAGNLAAVAHYEDLLAKYTRHKVAEFGKANPDVVLLQLYDKSWIERFSAIDPIARQLAGYRVLVETPMVRVLVRK